MLIFQIAFQLLSPKSSSMESMSLMNSAADDSNYKATFILGEANSTTRSAYQV